MGGANWRSEWEIVPLRRAWRASDASSTSSSSSTTRSSVREGGVKMDGVPCEQFMRCTVQKCISGVNRRFAPDASSTSLSSIALFSSSSVAAEEIGEAVGGGVGEVLVWCWWLSGRLAVQLFGVVGGYTRCVLHLTLLRRLLRSLLNRGR